ncbi:ABC transporter ATP-binding protein [Bordetella sp. N]|uniref:ABC transporter ATP-binding protein n=1 Tax=Bordetella sp. N TaxID=1746199 RepID=UPI000711057F|nr:ATP-binding cassette domain-containing protein [Bordetella sp. N]ALM82677.1 iron-hydroxamate transporter ATP-binding subunit [Bordetella sp. N]
MTATVTAAAAPAYTLKQVSYAIDGRQILSGLDLRIPAGKVVGIIGHNGSGKSTLVRLLARQIKPAAGEVHLGTEATAALSAREFARRVAYLPQQIPGAPGMTVKELVTLGRYPWLGPLRSQGPEDRRMIEHAMAVTHIEALAQRLVDTLSGGERQRVWLAMLVAQGAQCLILDEPISALDIAHQVEVLALLRRLCSEQGLSVVVVLHDIYMAGRYCDELIAMRAGRVVARGDAASLLTPETLREIYHVDMDVLIHAATGDRVVCLRE